MLACIRLVARAENKDFLLRLLAHAQAAGVDDLIELVVAEHLISATEVAFGRPHLLPVVEVEAIVAIFEPSQEFRVLETAFWVDVLHKPVE